MPSFNRVILMGNLTRDPELRHLPSNTAVTGIALAVNDRWKDKDSGEWKDRANFIDCEAFGRTAEVINEYFRKGKPILIEGRLRMDQWQDKEGNNRSKLKVVIDGFEFIGSRNEGGDRGGPTRSSNEPVGAGQPTGGHQPLDEQDIPF